jgi:hypothetical protein
MKMLTGRFYENSRSALGVKIDKIWKREESYVLVSGLMFNKRTGLVLGRISKFKLIYEDIISWRELEKPPRLFDF